jgi:eukaryotic-like serine/threonine-protein kinase
MKEQDNARVREILDQAAELPSEQRGEFLEVACAGDAKVRAEVELLLASLDQADDFLRDPTIAPEGLPSRVFAGSPRRERAGEQIGRYKLLQLIGEGGFGSVFMAEQQTPVIRKVALKIIKLGMDSAAIIARFEAERQALAMMDHPNIARVLDAGTTDSGRPFFVMELVQGLPINDYCDRKRLTPRQRIELFVPVCRAVQHAHQKGIIHRDLKPSNILVMIYDGQPVPKVIDFGVAKALNQRLTEKTLFTQFGHAVGTPEYMSPEQAEMDVIGADTRSDIYSLGALLYELLTGATPLDRAKLHEAGYAQMLRIIREEEPPRPSTRLTQSGDALANISSSRGTDPSELTRLTAGDLDWIVMKCLEKDRARRYETADGLARDLERYLRDEPVEASPPTAGYRVRKFMRRNRGAAIAAGAIAGALMLGVAGLAIGLIRTKRAEAAAVIDRDTAMRAQGAEAVQRKQADEARTQADDARKQAEQVTSFLVSILNSPNPYDRGSGTTNLLSLLGEAVQRLNDAALDPESERRVRTTIGLCYGATHDKTRARRELRVASDLAQRIYGPRSAQFAYSVEELAGQCNEPEQSSLYRKAQELFEQLFGPDDRRTISAAVFRADHLRGSDDATAEKLVRHALDVQEKHPVLSPNVAADAWRTTAEIAARKGDWERAKSCFRRCFDVAATDRIGVLFVHYSHYADVMDKAGDNDTSDEYAAKALAAARDVTIDATHPLVRDRLSRCIDLLLHHRKYAQAEPLIHEYWNMLDGLPHPEPKEQAAAARYLNSLYSGLSRTEEAATWLGQSQKFAMANLRSIVAQQDRILERDANDLDALKERGSANACLGQFSDAARDFAKVVELSPTDHRYWHEGLVPVLAQVGDYDGFRRWRSRELQQFKATSDTAVAHRIAKDAFMYPIEGEEMRIALDLADRGLAEPRPGWGLQTKGMAEYRRGNYQQAIILLSKSTAVWDWVYTKTIADLLIAMSYEHLGDHGQARACLSKSA